MDVAYVFMFGPNGLKVFGPYLHPDPVESVLRIEAPLNPGARFFFVDPMSEPPWPQIALKEMPHDASPSPDQAG